MRREEAEKILDEAARVNGGAWISHSKQVALAAEKIAISSGIPDSDRAYIFGLLHDIGKKERDDLKRHPITGYDFMIRLKEPEIAQICLTHPFTLKEPREIHGYASFGGEDKERMENLLASVTYSDYDRLIQLCDSIALPEGIVLLEKRIVDVHMRHGFNENTTRRWKKLFEIKDYFEEHIGGTIYDLFPESVNLTFGADG